MVAVPAPTIVTVVPLMVAMVTSLLVYVMAPWLLVLAAIVKAASP